MTRPSNTNNKEPVKSSNKNDLSMRKPKQEPVDCYNVIGNEGDDDICELEHLRKLFIGGLAPYTTEDSLKGFYEQWGKVVDVVVMRDTVTRRSRGFGFITYTKASMVDSAQDARPHVIDGKTVEAKRALPRPEREKREPNISVKKLFVGGLKDNHDDDCLHEYFSQFGKVVSVKILTDKTTGKRRGFAFIEFDDYDAVDKAILQKSHSIKYVMVDVKKSVYSQEQRNATANKHIQNNNQLRPNMPGPPPPAFGQPNGPGMHPYNAPPMNSGPPPPNYNYWNQGAPPAPPPPYYGGYQQPPPQPPMNNWNYPAVPPSNWNAGPPPPPGPQPSAVNWQPQGQWGPPQSGVPPAVAPAPNWNAAPAPAPQNGPPAVAVPQQGPPQQQPVNFGAGYQQNYAGGPTKNSNMGANRMNPYGAPPHSGYGNHGKPPSGTGYNNYNGAQPSGPPGVGPNTVPPNSANIGPKPVPPVASGPRRY